MSTPYLSVFAVASTEGLLLFASIILCEIIFDFVGEIDARSAISLAAADNNSVIFRSVQPVHHGNECESNLYANECGVLCVRLHIGWVCCAVLTWKAIMCTSWWTVATFIFAAQNLQDKGRRMHRTSTEKVINTGHKLMKVMSESKQSYWGCRRWQDEMRDPSPQIHKIDCGW